jgi:hypothetical protein
LLPELNPLDQHGVVCEELADACTGFSVILDLEAGWAARQIRGEKHPARKTRPAPVRPNNDLSSASGVWAEAAGADLGG